MIKKILSLAFVFVMLISVFALSACGNSDLPDQGSSSSDNEKESTYSIIDAAVKKTLALNAFDAELNMDLRLDMSGMTVNIPTKIKLKATDVKTDSPKILTDMTVSTMGLDMNTKVYQENGYFYITLMGVDMKVKAGEFTKDYDNMDDLKNMLVSIPEEVLKDVAVLENADGTKSAAISIPDDQIKNIFGDFVAQANASLIEDMEVKDLHLKNAKVMITVDQDGYVCDYDIEYGMTMKLKTDPAVYGSSEMTYEVFAQANLTYNHPGTDVVVTAPEGYLEFIEMEEEDLMHS